VDGHVASRPARDWRDVLSTERCAYSAIRDRRPLALSGGARLAVRIIVHIDEWNPGAATPRPVLTPDGQTRTAQSEQAREILKNGRESAIRHPQAGADAQTSATE